LLVIKVSLFFNQLNKLLMDTLLATLNSSSHPSVILFYCYWYSTPFFRYSQCGLLWLFIKNI